METRTTKRETKAVKKLITRSCSICAKKMKVTVFTDKSYSPGHYFASLGIKEKNAEYWECDACFADMQL